MSAWLPLPFAVVHAVHVAAEVDPVVTFWRSYRDMDRAECEYEASTLRREREAALASSGATLATIRSVCASNGWAYEDVIADALLARRA